MIRVYKKYLKKTYNWFVCLYNQRASNMLTYSFMHNIFNLQSSIIKISLIEVIIFSPCNWKLLQVLKLKLF